MKKNLVSSMLSAAMVLSLAASMTSHASASALLKQDASVVTDKTVKTGTLLISVNPEIKMDYNYKGRVLKLSGMNESGRAVVRDMKNYQYDPCDEVMEDLIREIYEDGYFDTQKNQPAKNLLIKLEAGSKTPDSQFLEDVADSARYTLKDCGLKSSTITVNTSDLDNKGRIGIQKARELALAHAGLKDAVFSEGEYDLDDGIYELEFTAGGIEYEYEVNAFTGKITAADREHNDDWDAWNDDDRYDDDHDDDDRFDDDRFDDDHDDDDRFDDDRFDDDHDDDDHFDDDRFDDDRFDDDHDDDDHDDDDRFDDDHNDDDRDDD